MFTGLIEDVGTLQSRSTLGKAGKLTVKTALPLADVRLGDSVAVNGTCLTVEGVQPRKHTLVFHTLAETLRRTNLGKVTVGGPVNLERALRLGDRLGGHLVSGHVDATAKILHIGRKGDDWVLEVELPEALAPLVVEKGSIAVDGISLTVATAGTDAFTVHLIPHTWAATHLHTAKVGQAVNLEADMVGRYLLRQQQLATGGRPLTREALEEAGFG